MPKITIVDLEMFVNVGVGDEERAKPQRILLTLDMEFDFAAAAMTDRVTKTIDYFAVAQRMLQFVEGRNWKLIEKLAHDLGDVVLSEFQPADVMIEVKKFPIPQAKHVSVSLTKSRTGTSVKRMAWGIP